MIKTLDTLTSQAEINIIDDLSGKSMPIKFAPDATFTVGPFRPVNEKNLEHTFRLFYFDSNS